MFTMMEPITRFTLAGRRTVAENGAGTNRVCELPVQGVALRIIRNEAIVFNGTWTSGEQRELRTLPGGNADCGQFASGALADGYRVGSVDPFGNNDQVPDGRTPIRFDPNHGILPFYFRTSLIPARATAVSFLKIGTQAFHYARLLPDGGLLQTDANRADQPGMGGTYINFAPGPNGTPSLVTIDGQRGVQPVQALPNLNAFVNYCEQNYGLDNSLFFFCHFA